MSAETMLALLKVDLGITSTGYDVRLASLLTDAANRIIREGASTLSPSDSAEDANLVIMYAGWLWRKRDTMEGMPRMLRWALNNRIFAEKAAGTATAPADGYEYLEVVSND